MRQGGVWAAAGFRYQYLRTLEALLDIAEFGPKQHSVQTEDQAADGVDYAVRDISGRATLLAQVKYSIEPDVARTIGPKELRKILLKLVSSESQKYVLQTNRRLSVKATSIADLVNEYSTSPGHPNTAVRVAQIFGGVPRQVLSRLTRVSIEVDSRTSVAIYSELQARIRTFRRGLGRGAGDQSSRLLLNHLIHDVFERSAVTNGSALTVSELKEMLNASELTVARTVGEYDWGVLLGPVPPTPSTSRLGSLEDLGSAFAGSVGDRTPRRLALVGLSGIGKSSLAAQYVHTFAAAYDWIGWVDCESTQLIRRSFEDIVESIGGQLSVESLVVAPDDQHARLCAEFLSKHPGTWLLVLDAAPSAKTVAPWLPPVGRFDCIATSTDTQGWPRWRRLELDVMTEHETRDLIATRLQLSDSLGREEQTAIDALISKTGKWPLAVELACAFLSTSGRGLRFASNYLEALAHAAYATPELLPDYPRSLVASVALAVDELQTNEEIGQIASATLEVLSLLPSSGVPMSTAIQGAHSLLDGATAELGLRDVPEVEIDQVFRLLRRRGLVRRLEVDPSDAPGLVDRVATNEVILDLTRARLGERGGECVGAGIAVLSQHLVKFGQEKDFQSFRNYLPICLSLVRYLRSAPNLDTPFGMLSLGNLAEQLIIHGSKELAEGLLFLELKRLDAGQYEAPVLRLKIYAALATCAVAENTRGEQVLRLCNVICEILEGVGADMDPDERGLVIVRARNALTALRNARPKEGGQVSVALSRLNTLAESLEGSGVEVLAMDRALGMLAGIDDAESISVIRQALKNSSGEAEPQLRAGLVEALACDLQFEEAADELGRFIDSCESSSIPYFVGHSYLLNALTQHLCHLVGRPQEFIVHRLDDELVELLGLLRLEPYDAYLLTTARAALAALSDPVAVAQDALDALAAAGPAPPLPMTRSTDHAQRWIDVGMKSMMTVRQATTSGELVFPSEFLIRRIREAGTQVLSWVIVKVVAPDDWNVSENAVVDGNGKWIATPFGVGLTVPVMAGVGLWFPHDLYESAAVKLHRLSNEVSAATRVFLQIDFADRESLVCEADGLVELRDWKPDAVFDYGQVND